MLVAAFLVPLGKVGLTAASNAFLSEDILESILLMFSGMLRRMCGGYHDVHISAYSQGLRIRGIVPNEDKLQFRLNELMPS